MSQAPGLPAQPESESTPGALLKRERERRALSVQQAAEDLHLDPWVIEAIEANRFQALGAPVYAKGHLRKYATLLELAVEPIIEKYEALQDRPIAADPIPTAIAAPLPPPRRSLKGPIWIVLSMIVAGLLAWAAIEFFAYRRIASATPQLTSATRLPVTSSVAPTVPVAAPSSEQTTPQTPRPNPAPVESAQSPAIETPPVDSPAQSSGATAEPIQVRLSFAGDSWTEVYDAQGTRLMFAMGSEGRTRTLTGIPPLQVNLGSVSAVSLEVNGEPVAIPRREGRESVRFVIEPNGNLR